MADREVRRVMKLMINSRLVFRSVLNNYLKVLLFYFLGILQNFHGLGMWSPMNLRKSNLTEETINVK